MIKQNENNFTNVVLKLQNFILLYITKFYNNINLDYFKHSLSDYILVHRKTSFAEMNTLTHFYSYLFISTTD